MVLGRCHRPARLRQPGRRAHRPAPARAELDTGLLDPLPSREAFLATAGRVSDPVLLVYGADTPEKSKAEMEALATLPNVETAVLPRGKLATHEEFPDEVAETLRAFLPRPRG